MNPAGFEFLMAALGVSEKRIPSIDNYVTFGKKWGELADDRIHRRTGLYHNHGFPGTFESADEFFHRPRRLNIFPFCLSGSKLLRHFGGPIENRDRKALRLHIEDEVFAYDSETDQSDI